LCATVAKGDMFEMENPFHYGSIVTGENFVDREKELELLLKELRNRQRVVIYSNRRMGKSSLLKELARRNQKEFIFAYVDLYGITSKSKFLESLVGEVARAAYSKTEKLASTVREFLSSVRFRFVITNGGTAGVEFDRAEVRMGELTEILDFPERTGKKKGKPVVVMFDEFQEISSLDGVALLKRMRSRIQFHEHATYIFSGSKRHLLRQIFEEEEGAFFRSTRPMELGHIPKSEFEKFIIGKFKAAGGNLRVDFAKRIVDASRGYPYYAQQIAHELFDKSPSPSDPEEVESAIRTAVDHHAPLCQSLWDSIKSPLHRQYLLAVAEEPGVAHGTVFIERYGLKSYSHIQRIEKQLEGRGVIEAGDIVDPMFALWLRNLKGVD